MDGYKATSDQSEDLSYGAVLREVVTSLRSLIQSEIQLVKAEVKDTSEHVGKYAGQAALFGALLALSILPFLAFVVIGLGRLLDGNYWLSSLLTSVVCAAAGGAMTYRAYKRIKAIDLSLPRSREMLEWSKDVAVAKTQEVKGVLERDVAEITNSKDRRVSYGV